MDAARGVAGGDRHLPGDGGVLRLPGAAGGRGARAAGRAGGGVQHGGGAEVPRGGAAGPAADRQGPAGRLRAAGVCWLASFCRKMVSFKERHRVLATTLAFATTT